MMTDAMAVELGQRALMMVLILAAPPLLISLVVGLVISIFQAATQIQDQMITFVPRMMAVFLSLLLLAPWYMKMLTSYTAQLFARMSAL